MKIPALPAVEVDKVGMFRSRRLGKKVLLTNDIGHHVILSEADFTRFLAGKIGAKDPLHKDLRAKGFVRDFMDFESLMQTWKKSRGFLWHGPALHIIVVTLRCNHRCVYCQTSSVDMDQTGFDMTEETARKVVDLVFESPSPALTIEFQGGEPLANWPVVRFVVEYALQKNKTRGRKLWLNLVTNLTLMDDEKLDFLLTSGVNICTSLDGPAALHDANRVYLGGASHATVVEWWKKIKKRTRGKTFGIDALMTTTRRSLACPEEIIDEYVGLGARGVYLRQLAPYGLAQKTWDAVGYTPREYLEFYRKALDHIIGINLKRKSFFEYAARVFITKILRNEDPNFLDMRSPCGAGIGQMAYNYDGRIYTCDEARMLSRMDNETFCIGAAGADDYAQIVNHPTVRAVATASCLDVQAECSGCAYLPFCGICPVENYFLQGDLFPRTPTNGRCFVNKGIQDYLFEKLQDRQVKKVLKSWTRVPASLYVRE